MELRKATTVALRKWAKAYRAMSECEKIASYKSWLLERCKATSEDFEALKSRMDIEGFNKIVAAFGPGSGKTTAAAVFMAAHWQDGFLYSARTRAELFKMRRMLAKLGVPYQEILVVHCEQDLINENLKYGEEYWKKKIILTTHERLIIDTPNLWGEVLPTSTDFHNLKSDRRRKHFIIDEAFEIARDYNIVPIEICNLLAAAGVNHNFVHAVLYKEEINLTWEEYGKLARFRKFDNETCKRLLTQTLNLPNGPNLGNEKFPEIAEIRWNYIMRLIVQDLVSRKLLDCDLYKGKFIHAPILESQPCYMYILDGTGDLVFSDFINIERKYWNCQWKNVKLEILTRKNNFKLKRNSATDEEINEWFENYINPSLKRIAKDQEKCLVVTWKGLRNNEFSFASEDIEMKDPNSMVERLKIEISRLGLDDKFEVTSYLSGKTRATSEFKNCDSIFFLGSFNYNPKQLDLINELTGSKLANANLVAAEMIQSLFRTRLRLNKPVKAYLSNDIPIERLEILTQKLDCGEQNIWSIEEYIIPSSFEELLNVASGRTQRDILNFILEKKSELVTNRFAEFDCMNRNKSCSTHEYLKVVHELEDKLPTIFKFAYSRGKFSVILQDEGQFKNQKIRYSDLKFLV